jgi:Flp pilus assembly pilin Flp
MNKLCKIGQGFVMHKAKKQLHLKRSYKAQGLVEYALIIVLVAVVVTAIAFMLGLAVHRVYGLVAGSLGGNQSSGGAVQIRIEQARCIAQTSTNRTGMWVTGFVTPGTPLTSFEVHTTMTADTAFDSDSDGTIETMALSDNGGGGGFKWNPVVKTNSLTAQCPSAIMIRMVGNPSVFAIAPVTSETE